MFSFNKWKNSIMWKKIVFIASKIKIYMNIYLKHEDFKLYLFFVVCMYLKILYSYSSLTLIIISFK